LAVTAMSAETGLAARLAAEPPKVSLGAPDGTVLRAVDAVAESLLVAALLGELIVVLGNVFARVYLHHSFLWADEVARLALSTLAFIGGAVAYRRRDHAFVRVVLNLCSKRTQTVCMALADVLVLFVAGLTGVASLEFLASSWNERTPVLQLPAAIIGSPLPAGMALICAYAIVHLWREPRSSTSRCRRRSSTARRIRSR
jgi:TRAP-type C4-dicarboxylate transport system permease small subunit